ncbi:hypothetical protein MPSEU_000169300 [Mayamaea pseudoterrestris]|nr:hypothetical protein MPSEU_000169300 [Mayamaea pseudoterrestris]
MTDMLGTEPSPTYRQPAKSCKSISLVPAACVFLVLIFNVSEMLLLDGSSRQLLPLDGLNGAPVNHPAYFLRPKQRFRPLSRRKSGVQKDLVKAGDVIYFQNPDNWDSSPIVIPSLKLVFFTIPKVGCTVWKQLFRRIMNHDDWLSQDAELGLPHNPDTNGLLYLYNFTLREASTIMTSPDWTRAIMVREPKQRFLSSFLDKALSNDHRHIIDRCCPEDNSLLDAKHCYEAADSASGFLRLAAICDDQHWTPQHKRVDLKYWPYIDRVLHVENAAEDAKALLESLNSWSKTKRQRINAWDTYGRSGWGKHGNSSIFASQSIEAAGEHVTWAAFKHWKWLSPQIEMKVEQFYQADYENPLFNFTRGKCLTCT